MKVAVIGSRECGDFDIGIILRYLPENCSGIISGGAKGIDSLAQSVAKQLDINFECIPPDFEKNGRQAPLIRNDEIVRRADMVLAFWDFKSRGTAYTIVKCIELGVPVRVIGLND